jgi:DNA-binding NarL/FixJ family response regulator
MSQSQHEIEASQTHVDPGEVDRPNVVIVSDVVLYREGLGASLVRDGRLAVARSVSSQDALPAISQILPDVVLLDGGIPDSLVFARMIWANVPQVRIVGFGISGDVEKLVACAESGLAGFVDRDGSIDELVGAVVGAINGELACSPKVSALMCERLARLSSGGQQPEALTRREREVAVLIGEGLSNKEIAKDLSIGPSTVKNHVHNILEKLRVRRRSAVLHQLSAFPWARRAPSVDTAEY